MAESIHDRSTEWPKVLGVPETRMPNHYTALLELVGETRETADQIERDLPRTFARDVNGSGLLAPLKRVLTAYASHIPEVGYVQAMNYIAAFLLLAGVEEEDSFWCLVIIVRDIMPGYFERGMPGAIADQRLFAALLRKHMPNVGLHMTALAPENLVCGTLASQWLPTLFANVLPRPAALLLWDCMLVSRSRTALFAGCFALIELARPAILATTEMGECIELLQGLGPRVSDVGAFGEAVFRFNVRVGDDSLDDMSRWEAGPADALLAKLRDGLASPQLLADELGSQLTVEAEKEADGLLAVLGVLQGLGADLEAQATDFSSEKAQAEGVIAEQLSEHMLAVDRALRSTDLLVREQARVVAGDLVVQPLTAFQTAKLPMLYADIIKARDTMQPIAQRVLSNGVRGTALERGNPVTLWNAWEEGPFESAFTQADVLLEAIDNALKAVCVLCASQTAILTKTSGNYFLSGPVTPEDPKVDTSGSNDPSPEDLIARFATAHRDRARDELQAFRSQGTTVSKAAHADVPLLAESHAAAQAMVAAYRSSVETAAEQWYQVAFDERCGGAQELFSGMRAQVESVLAVLGKGQAESVSSADRSAEYAREMEAEQVAIEEALLKVGVAQESLKQRSGSLKKQAEMKDAVGIWVQEQVSSLESIQANLDVTADAAAAILKDRCGDGQLPALEASLCAIERLTDLVEDVFIKRLSEWTIKLRDQVSFGCIQYMTLIDAACAIIAELSEQMVQQIHGELRGAAAKSAQEGLQLLEDRCSQLQQKKAAMSSLMVSRGSDSDSHCMTLRAMRLRRVTQQEQRLQQSLPGGDG